MEDFYDFTQDPNDETLFKNNLLKFGFNDDFAVAFTITDSNSNEKTSFPAEYGHLRAYRKHWDYVDEARSGAPYKPLTFTPMKTEKCSREDLNYNTEG